MSKESAISTIERGDLSELCHVLEESEWDIRSEPLDSKGQSVLHIACASGHLNIVQYLVIEKKCSVTVEDVYGQTPLLLSLINKQWKIADFLLQNVPNSIVSGTAISSCNVSFIAGMADEALLESCKKGFVMLAKCVSNCVKVISDAHKNAAYDNAHWDIMLYLMVKSGDSNYSDVSPPHLTAGHVEVALKNNLWTAAKALLLLVHERSCHMSLGLSAIGLQQMIDVVQYKHVALSIACSCGYLEVVKYYHIHCHMQLSEEQLERAQSSGNLHVVEYIIKDGMCTIPADMPKLHAACILGDVDKVKTALENNGQSILSTTDQYGTAGMHYAVCESAVLRIVIGAIRDNNELMNIYDSKRNTPLHHCIKFQSTEALNHLIGVPECHVNEKNLEGDTPLHIACSLENVAIVRSLLLNGADLSQHNNAGNTPIHIACNFQIFDNLMTLLDCSRCDPNVQNGKGDTALHIVCRMKDSECKFLQVLLSAPGVDTSIKNEASILPLEEVDEDGCPPLHNACQYGNSALVESLLEKGADILRRSKPGNAPIHIACMNRHLKCLKVLLDCSRCDANQRNADGERALDILCKMGKFEDRHVECLRMLVRCDINQARSTGVTPLHIACKNGNVHIIQLLLKENCNYVNVLDNHGDTPLHIAVESVKRTVEMVKCLLESHTCNPNLQNKLGYAPLHVASRLTNVMVIEILTMDKRCDVNVQSKNGNTPLHTAIFCQTESNRVERIQCLLQSNKCDPNIKNKDGCTPIHTACNFQCFGCLKVLLDCSRCDPNVQNGKGDTALHIVCRMKDSECKFLQVLLSAPSIDTSIKNEAGILPLEEVDEDGCPPLHNACRCGNSALVESLLEKGADILRHSKAGNAPIHIAYMNRHLKCLKILLDCSRCDANQRNADGERALDILCKMGKFEDRHVECLRMLVRCDINQARSTGVTPLHIACKNGNVHIIQLLLKENCNYVNVLNNHGDTPLHIAVESVKRTVEMVKCLLESHTCNPNLQNKLGYAPLHVASRLINVMVIEILTMDKRCDVNVQSKNGNTPLHTAIFCQTESNRVERIQCLLQSNKCDPNIKNKDGCTPLHTACNFQCFGCLKVLLDCSRCDPNVQNGKGDAALHIVCRMKDSECKFLQVLLSAPGVDSSIKNEAGILPLEEVDEDGCPPLHNACQYGNCALVESLLAKGADITQLSKAGNAPIHIACMNGHLKCLKVLLDCSRCDADQRNSNEKTPLDIVWGMEDGNTSVEFLRVLMRCNINRARSTGTTPLHIACKNGNIHIIQLLLKENCNYVNVLDNHGDTPLHIAVLLRTVETVKCLLEIHTCNPNLKNEVGYTPLHVACRLNNVEVIDMLTADKRCDVNTQSNIKNTALHIAVSSDDKRVKKIQCLLENNKCDPNIKNKDGTTSLHTACHLKHVDSLKVLLECSRCDPNVQNGKGDTALHIVCRMKDSECKFLQVLLSAPGVDTSIKNEAGILPLEEVDEDGCPPLHNACRCGNSALVESLLEKGADILRHSKAGNAPIHIAYMNRHLKCLKILLDCSRCDANQRNADGERALDILCKMGKFEDRHVEFLRVLVRCDINEARSTGVTPLHIACKNGSVHIIQLLLNENCNYVNVLDNHGDTPLHIAVKSVKRTVEMVKCLLEIHTCNPNLKNKLGYTPLHVACRLNNVEVIDMLIANKRCDVNTQNDNGNTALHIAAYTWLDSERLQKVKSILKNAECDLNLTNKDSSTPLHIVCDLCDIPTFEALIATEKCDLNIQDINGNTALHIAVDCIEMVQCLLERAHGRHKLNIDALNKKGSSPLHKAIANGSLLSVKLLLKNKANIQLPRNDVFQNAPIHIACLGGRYEMLKVVLSCSHCNPNQQNAKGNTALHIVCRMENSTSFLKALLSIPGIDPEILNHAGLIPTDLAGKNVSAISMIRNFVQHNHTCSQAYLKIFVVGNSGAGKSTLIKTVTTEASEWLMYLMMRRVNPRDIPAHTAGIVPIMFRSKHFGNAILYDFAGQHEYYSSHAAVMKNLVLPSPPLFLVLIDISKPLKEIKKEIWYWWKFIEDQFESWKAAMPPHVILVGSHRDSLKGKDEISAIKIGIQTCFKDISVSFTFAGFFPLDCRRLASQELTSLLTQLNTTCSLLRKTVDINLHCHILKAFLTTPVFQDKVYCKTIDVVDQIETSDALLPQSSSELIPLFKALNDQGYILLVQNHTDESKSWVILKPNVLLTDVHGIIFAPDYFKEHSDDFANHTGVVTLSKLKERFPQYDLHVIIEYLVHFEFCFRIRDQHTLKMIINNETIIKVDSIEHEEEYYFFPGLVSVEVPADICQPEEQITFECGWLYRCEQKAEQLTTRFLHVLILRLAFACEPTDNPTDAESVVLLRSCSVWKNGIAWWDNDFIETIVEVDLQLCWVAVMIRCPDLKRVQCVKLRTKVIGTILKTRDDICPAIKMREFLISPSNIKYPFEEKELTLYDMREIAKVVIEGKDYAKDTGGKNLISIPKLLPFEPYLIMGFLTERFFSAYTHTEVTAEDLKQLVRKCHTKFEEMKIVFAPNISAFQKECVAADYAEVDSCDKLFSILLATGFKTWRDFEQGFSKFSIFCGRNPMVSRGRTY